MRNFLDVRAPVWMATAGHLACGLLMLTVELLILLATAQLASFLFG